MFFKKWKHKAVKSSIDKLLAEPTSYSPSDGVLRIAVLIDSTQFSDDEKLLLIKNSFSVKTQITPVYYVNHLKEVEGQGLVAFDAYSFTWNAKLKNTDLQNFLDTSYDYFIGYYRSENLFLHYVSALVKADFKIGFPNEAFEISDLMIDVALDDVATFQAEMIKYLKILNRIK